VLRSSVVVSNGPFDSILSCCVLLLPLSSSSKDPVSVLSVGPMSHYLLFRFAVTEAWFR